MGLEDGVAHQHHTHKDSSQAQSGQQGTSQIRVELGKKQPHDRLAHDEQAHSHWESQKGGDA